MLSRQNQPTCVICSAGMGDTDEEGGSAEEADGAPGGFEVMSDEEEEDEDDEDGGEELTEIERKAQKLDRARCANGWTWSSIYVCVICCVIYMLLAPPVLSASVWSDTELHGRLLPRPSWSCAMYVSSWNWSARPPGPELGALQQFTLLRRAV